MKTWGQFLDFTMVCEKKKCHLFIHIHRFATQLEKEKEAEAKYEALKLQVQLVRDFAVQLSHLHVSSFMNETITLFTVCML